MNPLIDSFFKQVVTYNVFQRAIVILNDEKSWNYQERKAHVAFINSKHCNPYIDHNASEIENKDGRIEKIEDELEKQKDVLKEMKEILEFSVRNI